MATLDQMEVFYDRKIQLRQFEPVTAGGSGVLTLEPDDDPAEVYALAQAELQEMVERELAERLVRSKLDELGPSVPTVKAVIRDHAEGALSDDAITEIAKAVVADAE